MESVEREAGPRGRLGLCSGRHLAAGRLVFVSCLVLVRGLELPVASAVFGLSLLTVAVVAFGMG